jgi:hypothetical protein
MGGGKRTAASQHSAELLLSRACVFEQVEERSCLELESWVEGEERVVVQVK